jgi:hypothetical protein
MSDISYCGVISRLVTSEILEDTLEEDRGFWSSMTKLCICERLLTLILGGDGGEGIGLRVSREGNGDT